MPATRALYLPDFMTGILAALAANRVPFLSLRRNRLDQAFSRLSQDIKQEAENEGMEVKFRIRLHPIHQDSTQLQQALYEAAQRDLISLDNPEFQRIRLKITPDEAPAYLNGLPGSPRMYVHLAERLMKYYQDQDEETERTVE
jgi:hypothetical protein